MKKKLLMILSAWMCAIGSLYAQGQFVQGKVSPSDNTGEGLPGVSVTVRGSSAGVSTDVSGNYRIQAAEGAVLVFRFLGFKDQEITVGNQSTINVVLDPSSNALTEVVVTALGIKRSERSLGYSTQQVDGDKLTLTKEQNILGSLAGKVAGAQVTGSSGASMGGTQKIKIRGVNSINGADQPLIVIDGTPISNANFAGSDRADYGNVGQDVNPDDVESINVLKGPAASALYGIRGQYGVILITTKKGSKGAKKVSVDFNSASSVERASNFFALQNVYGGGSSQVWRTLPNGQKYVDMSIDESWGPKMDGTMARQVYSFYPQDAEYGQLTPFVAHPTNIEDYYELGTNFNNGVSIAGGSENSTFRLSFNDTRIGGVEPNTFLRRNNLGVSAGLDLTSKLNASVNFNYARNNAQRPSQGSEYGARYMVQWFQRNIDMNRMKNYRYADGTFLNWNLNRPNSTTGEITNFKPLYWNNPYFENFENPSIDSRDRFFGDVGLTYQLFPSLKVSGFVRSDMFTQNIETKTAFNGRRVPAYSADKYQNRENNYEFLAQYTKNIGDFSLNGNLGSNIYSRRYSSLTQATAGGLSSPGFFNIAASIDRPTVSSYLLRKEIRSVYAMGSVGWKDTYFLDASIRNDNSSALPKNNNSYWYPSVSGSMVFSEFFRWKPLSFGKIRASYAQAGSDLSPYSTAAVFGVGSVYAGTTAVNTLTVPDNLANPNIEPSFAHSYEAGIDLKFFNNRLGADFTYYTQKNKNQIISLDVSGASGFGSTTINAGLIQNKGIELTLTGTPVQSKLFSWDVTINFNKNRSEVVELAPGIDVYTYDNTTYSSVSTFVNSYVGRSFGSLIGKAYSRDASGNVLYNANNLPLYTDATTNFGSVLPDYTGGMQNSFRIGKFDLGAMVDYQVGGQFFSRSAMLLAKTGMAPETAATNDRGFNVRDAVATGGGVKVSGVYGPGVIVGGQNVAGQAFTGYADARSYFRTTLGTHVYEEWLYDASYVKLREVKLGYTFNDIRLGTLPVRAINVALIARNPVQIWQKAPKGLDPSEISTGSQSISWYESGTANSVRTFGFNLNVTF